MYAFRVVENTIQARFCDVKLFSNIFNPIFPLYAKDYDEHASINERSSR